MTIKTVLLVACLSSYAFCASSSVAQDFKDIPVGGVGENAPEEVVDRQIQAQAQRDAAAAKAHNLDAIDRAYQEALNKQKNEPKACVDEANKTKEQSQQANKEEAIEPNLPRTEEQMDQESNFSSGVSKIIDGTKEVVDTAKQKASGLEQEYRDKLEKALQDDDNTNTPKEKK